MTTARRHQRPDTTGNCWITANFDARRDRHAFDQWRESLAEVLDVSVDKEAQKHFRARVSLAKAGYGLLMKTKADEQMMSRSVRHVRRDAVDHFCIALLRSGINDGNYDGVSSRADASSILFVDDARASRRHYSRFDALRLLIPRSRLSAELRGTNVHGLTVPVAQAGAALLASHIQGLARRIHQLDDVQSEAAIEAAMLLLPGALNAALPPADRDDPAFDRPMISMIKTHIDQNLYGFAPSPAAISRAFGLSRSSLYRLFESEGGVVRYIINRKLDLGRRLLNRNADEGVFIRTVAHTVGFKSEAHFSRAFKARFGLTPREARQMCLEHKIQTALDACKNDVKSEMLKIFKTLDH